MAVSIVLDAVKAVTAGPTYSVAFTASQPNGVPVYVFVYRADTNEFTHVADVNEMYAYPPVNTSGVDYYRTNACSRTFTTVAEANEFYDVVRERLRVLMAEYDRAVSSFVGTSTETISS